MSQNTWRCSNCEHFVLDPGTKPFGHCSRWHRGYRPHTQKLNEVTVENDEGWCNEVGPEFGCVLFKRKKGTPS